MRRFEDPAALLLASILAVVITAGAAGIVGPMARHFFGDLSYWIRIAFLFVPVLLLFLVLRHLLNAFFLLISEVLHFDLGSALNYFILTICFGFSVLTGIFGFQYFFPVDPAAGGIKTLNVTVQSSDEDDGYFSVRTHEGIRFTIPPVHTRAVNRSEFHKLKDGDRIVITLRADESRPIPMPLSLSKDGVWILSAAGLIETTKFNNLAALILFPLCQPFSTCFTRFSSAGRTFSN